jgi:hypothetical protein
MRALTFVEIDVPEFSATNAGEKTVVPGLKFDFETGSILGWAAEQANLTATTSGMIVAPTSPDPIMRSPAGLAIDGGTQRYIRLDVERLAVRTAGTWQGAVLYITSGHPESGSFVKTFPELDNTIGARQVYVIDMHALTAGGTDWADNIITRLRIDFEDGQVGAVTPNGQFKIHSVIVGERIETFRFAEDTAYLPAEFDAIASLQSVSFSPATISLGKDLGQRASITATFTDHKHIFAGEPFSQGSFWGKWRGRYATRLRGRPFRLIRGLAGQALTEMDVRHYVIETTDGPTPGGSYTIEAKDVLKLADNDRAQAPLLSNGRLAGSINDTATAAILAPTGIGSAEYPAAGFICFGGKEVAAFTRAGDSLTLTRAQLAGQGRATRRD